MRTRIALAVAAAALTAAFLPAAASAPPAVFKVGAASRDITPNPVVAPPDGNVYLGGFGIGKSDNRLSEGVATPISVRAMVISNGTDTLAFGINETQGMFAAYQQGPYGLDDQRAAISAATGIPVGHIVLGSDHSHRGPDTTGVWGGVPNSYLQYIKDQMVGAVVDAVAAMRDATITAGSFDEPALWGGDTWDAPEQDVKDTVVRVLQARAVADPSDVIVTFVEAPYHSTDYGSAKTIDPDWPGHLAAKLEDTYGGVGFGWQGDIGRQYAAGGGDDVTNGIFAAAQTALALGAQLTDGTVAGEVTHFVEPVTNPLYIYFLNAAYPVSQNATCNLEQTGPLCTPVARANTPQYGSVAYVGTYSTTFRIGEVLINGGPGEVYPNVQKGIVDRVDAAHHFFLGLAQDQLGYLIAPTTSWAQVVPQSGDNGIFNASPTIGDHLMCTQLASAAALGFTLSEPAPAFCPLLTALDS